MNKAGSIIALVGGAVSLLAYFALPVVNFGIFSLTAPQLLSFSTSASAVTQTSNDYFWVIWLAAAAAGGVCLLSLIPLASRGEMFPPVAPGHPPRLKITDLALGACVFIVGFALAGLGLAALVVVAATTKDEANINYLGSGLWIYGLGCGASLIGGIAQMLSKHH
jgi:hypothetical protein